MGFFFSFLLLHKHSNFTLHQEEDFSTFHRAGTGVSHRPSRHRVVVEESDHGDQNSDQNSDHDGEQQARSDGSERELGRISIAFSLKTITITI